MIRAAFLTLLLIHHWNDLRAQDSWHIEIGVNGLTCSACTRSVEMSLLRLNFVDSVAMSLEETEGKIITKKGSQVDFPKLAKAVTDAGFSIRFLKVQVPTKNLKVNPDGCFRIGNYYFQWVEYNGSQAKAMLQFVDEPFLPAKEFSRWKKKLKAGTCFDNVSVWHVTE